MRMAKASEADMEMALELVSAFEALGQRWAPCFPQPIARLEEGGSEVEDFDSDDDAHCGRALRYLLETAEKGSIGRVIWGMAVLLDPQNNIVDPALDHLEAHPRFKAGDLLAQLLKTGAAQRMREALELGIGTAHPEGQVWLQAFAHVGEPINVQQPLPEVPA